MGVVKRVNKAKTRRGKRALINKEPKLIENPKQCIFLRGVKCSQTVLNCVKDFTKLKKPHSVYFSRKNDHRPFEAANDLEILCKKYDSSLFGYASHNKKRPNNLVLGRTFDHQILDMVELGIEKFKGLDEFKNAKVGFSCKPCLIFTGESFHTPSSELFRLKNIFVDFFHGEEVTNIRLEGIEHVLQFVQFENHIFLRSYRVVLKKSDDKTPYVELEEIGPSVDFVLRRTKLASEDLFKSACKQPKELKVKKVKNISKDVFGSKLGRVHMPKQNLSNLPTRNMKGLKKSAAEQKIGRAKKVATRKENAKNGRSVTFKEAGPSAGSSFNRPTGHVGGPWSATRSAGTPTPEGGSNLIGKLNTSRPSMLLNVSSENN